MNGGSNFNFTTVEAEKKYHVTNGDLLFAWSGNRGTSFGPFLWQVDGLYYLNQHIFRLEGFTVNKVWFYWLLKGVTAYVEKQAHGIIGLVHITKQELGSIRVPVVSQFEQQRIACFLDRETSKIDALIAKKERLIALLQEKRTALISHAVTKGLDPKVSIKPSHVVAVGDVPCSWDTPRNKTLFREVDQRSVSGDEELLTVSHITGVTRRADKPDVTMFLAESLEGYKRCEPGDLVVNTMWAYMGAVGIARQHGVVSPSYNVYRLRQPSWLSYDYLDLLYRSPAYKCEMYRHSQGVWQSRLRLYPDAFFDMLTLVPPLEEQHRIVEHVGVIASREDRKLKALQGSIDKLREYRTALISAAVTGKIDVREEVAVTISEEVSS